jgi:uncharacterized protein involved in exopolysaccharide biosynthesis
MFRSSLERTDLHVSIAESHGGARRLTEILSPPDPQSERHATDVGFLDTCVTILSHLVLAAKNHTLLLIAVFVASISVFTTCIVFAPAHYSSTTDIYVDPKTPQSVNERPYDGDSALATMLVESQARVIGSERIALAVIDRLGLRPGAGAMELRPPSLIHRWLNFNANEGDDATIALRTLVATLHSNLKVTRLERTFVVEVTYTSNDPNMAKNASQAFAEVYVEDLLNSARKSAKVGSDWLAERLEGLRAHALSADSAVEALRSTGDRADPVALNDLQSQAQVARLAYENFLRRFTDVVQQESFPISVARIVSDASIPAPTGLGRSALVLLALFLAAVLAVCATALAEYGRTFRFAGALSHAT